MLHFGNPAGTVEAQRPRSIAISGEGGKKKKKKVLRIFISVCQGEFGPGKWEKRKKKVAKRVRVPAPGVQTPLLAPAAQPTVVATLCACLFLVLLKPAPTS